MGLLFPLTIVLVWMERMPIYDSYFPYVLSTHSVRSNPDEKCKDAITFVCTNDVLMDQYFFADSLVNDVKDKENENKIGGH